MQSCLFCLILFRNNKFIHHIGACHEVKLDLVKDILPLLTVNELTMKYVLSIIPKALNRLDLDTNWYFNLETQFVRQENFIFVLIWCLVLNFFFFLGTEDFWKLHSLLHYIWWFLFNYGLSVFVRWRVINLTFSHNISINEGFLVVCLQHIWVILGCFDMLCQCRQY